MKSDSKLELLIIITNLNHAKKIIEKINDLISFPTVCGCRGTALKSTLDALGLGSPKRDLIIAFCKTENTNQIYEILSQPCLKTKVGKIAFTLPVDAVSGMVSLQILLGNTKS